ncbi:MAG: hypothetical protein Q4A92_07075 [Corynebacterium sp.]|nr:hypothetical protein [Corynebacterium sp.]
MYKLALTVITVMSMATLTACSLLDTTKPEISATSTATFTPGTQSEVSNAQFDTGEYKVTTTEIHQTDKHMARYVESFVLGEYLPLPFEIDGKLSETNGALNILTPESLRLHFAREQIDVLEKNPPLYGFVNAAASRTEDATTPPVALTHVVLRFNDPETAQKTAEAEHELLIAKGLPTSEEGQAVPDTAMRIDGMRDSLISTGELAEHGTTYVTSLTPHQEYVIYTWAQAPSDDAEQANNYVKKALEQQIPLLEQFPSVKTDAGYGKTDEFPSIDPGNVFTYAVPYLDDIMNTWAPGSFGPRGIAAQFSDSQVIYNSLVENGVEHIGRQYSYVFRAKNKSGAKAVRETFINSKLRHGGTEYDEPQGVPNTTCTATPFDSGTRYECYVLHENYIGYIANDSQTEQGNDDQTKRMVSQKTAAQHLIFQQIQHQ